MALVEFKDLPNTTTPLNATNLNNNFNELAGDIEDLQELTVYSTTDKVVGKWTDGKPIYRIVLTTTFGRGDKTVSLSHLNIDTVIKFDWVAKVNNKYLMNCTYGQDTNGQVLAIMDGTNLFMSVGTSWSTSMYTFIFEYTKTTD